MSGDVQAVARADALLDLLRSGPLGISDLAAGLALSAGTVHRLARTLVSLGLARQLDDRRYALGARLVPLGMAAHEQLGARARPILVQLTRRFEESANLAALNAGGAEYVAQVAGPHAMRMFTEVGRRVPLHATGVGKAMLSTMSDDAVLDLLGREGMAAFTPRTLVDPQRMLAELARIRRRGYAIDDDEMEVGVRCVAVPFRGAALMAVSVSGPSGRFTAQAAAAAAPEVATAAERLAQLFA